MVWNVGTGKIINVFRINNAGTRDTINYQVFKVQFSVIDFSD